jgi:hypothetical protein
VTDEQKRLVEADLSAWARVRNDRGPGRIGPEDLRTEEREPSRPNPVDVAAHARVESTLRSMAGNGKPYPRTLMEMLVWKFDQGRDIRDFRVLPPHEHLPARVAELGFSLLGLAITSYRAFLDLHATKHFGGVGHEEKSA